MTATTDAPVTARTTGRRQVRHFLEMCAAMYAPLALLPLVWLGTMVLAMLAVVVWRPDHRS